MVGLAPYLVFEELNEGTLLLCWQVMHRLSGLEGIHCIVLLQLIETARSTC